MVGLAVAASGVVGLMAMVTNLTGTVALNGIKQLSKHEQAVWESKGRYSVEVETGNPGAIGTFKFTRAPRPRPGSEREEKTHRRTLFHNDYEFITFVLVNGSRVGFTITSDERVTVRVLNSRNFERYEKEQGGIEAILEMTSVTTATNHWVAGENDEFFVVVDYTGYASATTRWEMTAEYVEYDLSTFNQSCVSLPTCRLSVEPGDWIISTIGDSSGTATLTQSRRATFGDAGVLKFFIVLVASVLALVAVVVFSCLLVRAIPAPVVAVAPPTAVVVVATPGGMPTPGVLPPPPPVFAVGAPPSLPPPYGIAVGEALPPPFAPPPPPVETTPLRQPGTVDPGFVFGIPMAPTSSSSSGGSIL